MSQMNTKGADTSSLPPHPRGERGKCAGKVISRSLSLSVVVFCMKVRCAMYVGTQREQTRELFFGDVKYHSEHQGCNELEGVTKIYSPDLIIRNPNSK